MYKLVFITGASGFLGAHVAQLLLEKGYRVRASARAAKVDYVKEGFASFGDKLEVVTVEDIATSDMTQALAGVDAIVHVAAPLARRGGPDVLMSGAIGGTLNVLRQGYAAGVRKFVLTSSIVTAFDTKQLDREEPLTDQDWNPGTIEEAFNSKDPGFVYSVAKTAAEKEAWKFADEKGDVDVTTLNPPFLWGPFASSFPHPAPNSSALSTNYYIFQLLDKEHGAYPRWPGWADVRDVAQAHVLALETDTLPSVPHKRILISGEWLDYAKVGRYIAAQRPEVKDRIVDPEKAPTLVAGWRVDMTRSKELFGLGREDLRTWKVTLLETVDVALRLEKEWAAQGVVLEM
ncbi:hypothetical protein OF83DRAFT_461726 [Amylostereum chailletii]|nr:hypothetical protein OF83DRAFT_461726 [Amylostereum chailletii]